MDLVDDDVVAFVDGDVQIGDPLDGVADQIQVLATVIFRTSAKENISVSKKIKLYTPRFCAPTKNNLKL